MEYIRAVINFLDAVTVFISLATFIVSVGVWLGARKARKIAEALVRVTIHVNDDIVIKTNAKIRRKNLTRSEVLGVLGMVPNNNPNGKFELSYINDPTFFEALEDAQINPKCEAIVIKLKPKESAQYVLGNEEESVKFEKGTAALLKQFAEKVAEKST